MNSGKPWRSQIGIARCEWHWRASASHRWEAFQEDCIQQGFGEDGDNVQTCRASVGPKIVTVWLPAGAVIKFRRSRVKPDDLTFHYVYGRNRENLIKITVTLNTLTGRLAASEPNLQQLPLHTPEGGAIKAAFHQASATYFKKD